MADYRKIVQSVAYLAGKSGAGGLNRLHAFKLLYLADRDHLRRCGSLVTGDTYNAMKYGPVPFHAKRLLMSGKAEEAERGYADRYLRMEATGRNGARIHCVAVDMEQLSRQDVESLDAAWGAYEAHPDIVGYTHLFPEWSRAVERAGGASSAPMETADFFLAAPADAEYCKADPDWVRDSKRLWAETAWADAL